ncbi:MAG: signal peptidase II [Coriobacteriia bacterium]|nr:signal peptidase II [Actinomycetota bacterium]MDZ4166365.1 signal peptidase II [Coriobacteriia bacterium]
MTRARALAFAVTVATVVVIDQVTKAIVRASLTLNDSIPVIDGVFWLTRVRNTGAAFGMFRGQQWLLISVGFVVLGVVAWTLARVRPESWLVRWGLALVTGGAIGNLIDRVFLGGVTDFFNLGWWPVFNVADISLDIGVVLIVVWLLFSRDHREAPASEDTSGEASAS